MEPVIVLDEELGAPLHWNPAWGDFSAVEWTLTGAGAATILAARLLSPSSSHATGGWGPDEDVREDLRLPTETGRRVSREISDITLTVSVGYPILIDSLLVAGWYRGNKDIALKTSLINAEVIAITLAIQGITNVTVSRERPYGRECGDEKTGLENDCVGTNRYRSFFSGHTSTAFAMAAASCSHHINLSLYQDPTADAMSCVGGFVVAGLTGYLRISGDQHYLTDVLTGAGVGTFVGFFVPWLFHYRDDGSDDALTHGADDGVNLTVVPSGQGAAIIGTF
ncbi:MAG: phosphatase PAP2 family protein [Myxococcales bacterium]|nr:phosphatase PAP2 family protein [Myxococcales bacterium]